VVDASSIVEYVNIQYRSKVNRNRFSCSQRSRSDIFDLVELAAGSGRSAVSSDGRGFCRAVGEATLVWKKFVVVRRAGRGIINNGGATVYAVLSGAGQEDQGMQFFMVHTYVCLKQLLTHK
jgi:hypothetical protein